MFSVSRLWRPSCTLCKPMFSSSTKNKATKQGYKTRLQKQGYKNKTKQNTTQVSIQAVGRCDDGIWGFIRVLRVLPGDSGHLGVEGSMGREGELALSDCCETAGDTARLGRVIRSRLSSWDFYQRQPTILISRTSEKERQRKTKKDRRLD